MNISGHIKEPLGTHGHMKVVMDKPISQQDTILMNLYKRVYPKWNYDPNVTRYVPEIKTKAKSSQEEIMDIMWMITCIEINPKHSYLNAGFELKILFLETATFVSFAHEKNSDVNSR